MALNFNTNSTTATPQRALFSATKALGKSYSRLATGLRITSAADDAAGLAISERLRARVRSLDQANRNAADGVSLVQTAEGALSEVSSILTRLRELAVQSANGSVSATDRQTLDEEFLALVDEVDRIGRGTEYNGISLLDGTTSSVSFQVGAGTDPTINTLAATLEAVLATGLAIDSLSLSTAAAASSAITTIDSAIDSVSRTRGSFGAVQNRLQYTISTLNVESESLTTAESRIRDVDVAYETAQLTRNSILQQAATSILTQANAQPQLALQLLG